MEIFQNEHLVSPIRRDLLNLLGAFIGAWTISAFGEELLFRGYLLNRFSELFGRSRLG